MRKPIVIKSLRLPGGNGITLWPFIFVSTKAVGKKSTFKHELMHWYQIEEMGVLKFYWEILNEYRKRGIYNGPLERECYEYKKEPLLSCEEEWWNE